MTNAGSPSKAEAPLLTPDKALFLDFDGTLATLQDNPDTVYLPDGGAALLLKLNQMLDGALVLISGRGASDLTARTPVEICRIGAHGLDVCAAGELPSPVTTALPDALLGPLHELIARYEGVTLEEKGRVAAIHYRQAPAVGKELLTQLTDLVRDMSDYRVQHGKMVIELKPEGANKGTALRAMCANAMFEGRVPIMVGDDTTDEDAMRAAMDLGGYGIKVGDGETCASYRLDDPTSVWRWIRETVNEHA